MKITIEQHETKVTIEVPSDDLTCEEVKDSLIIPALLAVSYHPETVNEAFNGEL